MKKTLFSLIVASIAAFATPGVNLNQTELLTLKKNIKLLQNPNLKLKRAKDLGNVTFVQMVATDERGQLRTLEGFIDNNTSSIYIGGGYDANGTKISFPMDFKVVEDAVAFTKGSGKEELYIVTDPECPYCRRFEQESKGKLDKYTVKTIFMPLSFHRHAKPMVNYILNADKNETASRFSKIMEGDATKMIKEYTNKDLKPLLGDYLNKSSLAVKELGVTGTPAFYIKDPATKTFIKTDWTTLLRK